MVDHLVRCPFCGGVRLDIPVAHTCSGQVACLDCYAVGPIPAGDTPESAWNRRTAGQFDKDIASYSRATALEEAARLCEVKVRRPAGHNGMWEGYGEMEGWKTGQECAIELRALIDHIGDATELMAKPTPPPLRIVREGDVRAGRQ